MEQKKIDMTTGPIMKNVFLFAIPIILGNILQYLYTTVDTLVNLYRKRCGADSLYNDCESSDALGGTYSQCLSD